MVLAKEAVGILRKGIFAVNKTCNVTSSELLNTLKDVIYEGQYVFTVHQITCMEIYFRVSVYFEVMNSRVGTIKFHDESLIQADTRDDKMVIVSTMDMTKFVIASRRNCIEPIHRPAHIRLGHGGTLDKSAVGVLVVGVNWGCKKLPLLLHGTKNYVVVGQLGIATDTYNETGRVVDERPYGHVRESDIVDALKMFVGEIWQAAPLYSALKVGGRRMSDLSREGMELLPKERKVRCYSAECTDFSPPFFTLQVRCGGGFYVRSLVHDIGIALSTCAHVRQLQRTQQGPFILHECLNENEWSYPQIMDSILMCQLKFSQYEKRLKNSL